MYTLKVSIDCLQFSFRFLSCDNEVGDSVYEGCGVLSYFSKFFGKVGHGFNSNREVCDVSLKFVSVHFHLSMRECRLFHIQEPLSEQPKQAR